MAITAGLDTMPELHEHRQSARGARKMVCVVSQPSPAIGRHIDRSGARNHAYCRHCQVVSVCGRGSNPPGRSQSAGHDQPWYTKRGASVLRLRRARAGLGIWQEDVRSTLPPHTQTYTLP